MSWCPDFAFRGTHKDAEGVRLALLEPGVQVNSMSKSGTSPLSVFHRAFTVLSPPFRRISPPFTAVLLQDEGAVHPAEPVLRRAPERPGRCPPFRPNAAPPCRSHSNVHISLCT